MTTNKLLKLPKFRKIRFDFRRRKKKFPSTPTHSLVIQADASGIDDSFAGTIESFPHPSEVAVLENCQYFRLIVQYGTRLAHGSTNGAKSRHSKQSKNDGMRQGTLDVTRKQCGMLS